jgi:ribonuclease HI
MNEKIIIFTDGASRGNPGPGGWGGIVISGGKILELGGRADHTTNNQMEITAAIRSLEAISKKEAKKPIEIYTDSSYLINGITKWVHGWQRKDWITTAKEEVLNKELWQELIRVSGGKNIEWKYIGGHRGVPGNERCDEIATAFADKKEVKFYKGAIEKYPVDVLNIKVDKNKSEKRSGDRSRSKAKAYSYLSLIDGKLMKHDTWEECEKRVKGKSGAKFKKALSAEDEERIWKEWGMK